MQSIKQAFHFFGTALQYGLMGLVLLYRIFLSPLGWFKCRHEPSCSLYTLTALREWGPYKGVFLGLRRILRCHPWGTSGYDPVPPRKKSYNQSP